MILGAILLAILFTAPSTVISPHNPAKFKEWDEQFYIVAARELSNISWEGLWKDLPPTPPSVSTLKHLYAHKLLNVDVGKLANWLDTEPVNIFLALDFGVILLFYYLLERVLRRMVITQINPILTNSDNGGVNHLVEVKTGNVRAVICHKNTIK